MERPSHYPCTLGLRHPWRKRFTLLFRYHRSCSANRFANGLPMPIEKSDLHRDSVRD
ncbi:hypothetical protein [Pectobacterium polaris]|uniref:hypothetical protein n=1 Tax=Pectobacterium polaris TaxID=2042057 RepID=UPI00163BDDA6|nr:hypothetical protein [Pectobacterium polaris]